MVVEGWAGVHFKQSGHPDEVTFEQRTKGNESKL